MTVNIPKRQKGRAQFSTVLLLTAGMAAGATFAVLAWLWEVAPHASTLPHEGSDRYPSRSGPKTAVARNSKRSSQDGFPSGLLKK